MEDIKAIVFVILLLIVTGGLVRFCTPEKIVYQTTEQQEQLDSLTVLNRSLVVTRDQLQDSLEETSQAFQDFVQKNKDKIASYNRIIGELNLEIDSLKGSSVSMGDLLSLNETNKYRDTTLVAYSVLGNGLFKGESRGGIRNDSLFVDPPEFTQLRPVRIDQAISVSSDQSKVMAITTSKDFEDLRVESYTELEPKKRFPWTEIVAVASFLLGYLL